MMVQKIHENWKMRQISDASQKSAEWIPAVVPGSVYNDLLLNKKMEDPYWRDNEDKAFVLMEKDYEYIAGFSVTHKMLGMENVLLRFEGLDTLAEISLNGVDLGKADNMHRTWEFDVKDLLKGEGNQLRVILRSPINFVNSAFDKCYVHSVDHSLYGFPHLRKCHCSFGWDHGPRLPDAGIWRDIKLVGFNSARIDNVFVTQKHRKDSVDLGIQVEVFINQHSVKNGASCSYKVFITDPKGKIEEFDNSPETISIKNPELWWPNGLVNNAESSQLPGTQPLKIQPLYTVKVILLSAKGAELDVWEHRVGLRTLTISRQKDKWGESFAHEVNGKKIFGMGANYIPEDYILPRVNAKRTRKLLEQCAAANYNIIRVWGGGYYPDDYFFDICDELGLIVWLDLMFACAAYELTPEFDHNIRMELEDNIKRIRHHACLGLYCGNNELETMYTRWPDVKLSPVQKSNFHKIFEYIIPEILNENDPVTFYWPSSPSSGGAFDDPQDPNRGDMHYWTVWHGNKPYSDYRNQFFRYTSEFGISSMPALKTVESFTLPEDRNVYSYIMERHQRNYEGNAKILNYMSHIFLLPSDFDTILYTTQLAQAEAIKYGVEHWRRNRGRCMGTMYWQVNDAWPVASWASIDYYFRWKALHYYAKRFYRPVMISCEEKGLLDGGSNPNLQPRIKAKIEKSFRLSAANETLEEMKLTVRWEIRDKNAKVLKEKSVPVILPALSAVWLDKVDVPDIAVNDEYLSYHLLDGKEVISEGTVIFSLPKYFHWVDPKLSYTVEGDTITVKASAYAKSVEIRNRNEDLLLSDNYFDMNAGEKKVKILSGKPGTLRLRSVWEIK
ncbi:MAG: glycoside hydrolase family 2 protein [Treponema sp.]|nr:glycoside hydrolase family 2 protein [Treponema sp.]